MSLPEMPLKALMRDQTLRCCVVEKDQEHALKVKSHRKGLRRRVWGEEAQIGRSFCEDCWYSDDRWLGAASWNTL